MGNAGAGVGDHRKLSDDKLLQQIRHDVGKDLIGRIGDKIRHEDRVFTGDAISSWELKDDEVRSELIWMATMEYGMMAGTWIPTERFGEWVRSSGKVRHDGTERDIKSKIYLIRKKIHDEGIKPTRIVRRTLAEMEGMQ